MLTDKEDILNYLGVNIKKNSDGTFEWLQSHILEKTINHVGLTVSASIKARKMPARKLLLNEYKASLGMKGAWNYRAAVGMLTYTWESTRPEVSMAIHQCKRFCNNLRMVYGHASIKST